jgi:predicted PurR-regulated permease PerM
MTEPGHLTVWKTVEAAAVLMVLGFLLFALRDVLNPILLFFVLWAVLSPFRGKPGHTPMVVVAGLLTGIWALATTGSLLAPLVLAFVLAYVLGPLVDRMGGRWVPRSRAIVILTLPVIGILGAFVFLVVPAAVGQLSEVIQQADVFAQRLADFAQATLERVSRLDVPLIEEEDLIARLRAVDAAAVTAFLQERQEALAAWAWGGFLGIGRGLGTVLSLGSYVVLTPVLTFYLLRDWDRITHTLGELLPHGRKEGIVSFAQDFDRLLSRYLRGQFTVALAIGVITGVGLAVVGFPYAATLGLIVAVFSVVPYLGLILSLVPAIFIALVSGAVGISLLKVIVVYSVAQILEGAFISPRIVGESVGLHPVWVVLALAMGGFFFGFVGLLIGVPGAVGVKLLIVRGLATYQSSDFFTGKASAPEV